MQTIHATAIVEDGAVIGKDVTIGAFCLITSNVKIGSGTTIASHTVIDGDTTIGENNRIFSHSVIGSIPQDLKFNDEDVKLIIGDNNTIREFAFINPGTIGGGAITRIGDGNLLMGYVHIGHDIIIGDSCIIANATNLGGHVEIGDRVVIGAMSAVHQFVKLGDYAMLAGASALTQDLPPFCMAQGNHASLRGLNLTGLRRHLKRESINELKVAYRRLFEEGKALQEVAMEYSSSNNRDIIKMSKFIQNSKRGIAFKRKIDV
jgi:UDP-N-acetylglucosamine acyltransferase